MTACPTLYAVVLTHDPYGHEPTPYLCRSASNEGTRFWVFLDREDAEAALAHHAKSFSNYTYAVIEYTPKNEQEDSSS